MATCCASSRKSARDPLCEDNSDGWDHGHPCCFLPTHPNCYNDDAVAGPDIAVVPLEFGRTYRARTVTVARATWFASSEAGTSTRATMRQSMSSSESNRVCVASQNVPAVA